MNYKDALAITHQVLSPRNYVEIGCRFGDSLKLADCFSVGIDPTNRLKYEFDERLAFYEQTSDEFFTQNSLIKVLGGNFDMGFIDGMHLVEFALRDFINLEKSSHSGSVIAVDDTLPEKNEYAGRTPVVNAWTGDVYRLLMILKEYRPDLRISVFRVALKGFTIIDKLDSTSSILHDNLDEISLRIENGDFSVQDVKDLPKIFDAQSPDNLENYIKHNIKPFRKRGFSLSQYYSKLFK